jgi:hypothetical protein
MTPLVVREVRVPRHLDEFYRNRKTGRGDYLLREEFLRWNPREVTDVVRRMRGFTVDVNGNYGQLRPDGTVDTRKLVVTSTRQNKRCEPQVFLDGVRFGASGSTNIDDFLVDALDAVEAVPAIGSRHSCGSIRLWSRQPEPDERSPFELGVRYGGGISGNARDGSRMGLHLVTPLFGYFEFYSAFHVLVSGRQESPFMGSGWQAHLTARAWLLSSPVPTYLGTGLVVIKPVTPQEVLWTDGPAEIESKHTVFAGTAFELGPTRPFAEVHVLDGFNFANVELHSFVGLGFKF